MTSKAIVLLSGGQDSTICLFWAMEHYGAAVAVSIFYEQRHRTELDAAVAIAQFAGVKHRILTLPVLAAIGGNDLVEGTSPVQQSFVPARNAIFFSLAAAVAVREGATDVIGGMCATDVHPDSSREFVDALERALVLGMPPTDRPLRLLTPLAALTKAEALKRAQRLPGCWSALALTVTCYEGTRPGCGLCSACRSRARGFNHAGLTDPAL